MARPENGNFTSGGEIRLQPVPHEREHWFQHRLEVIASARFQVRGVGHAVGAGVSRGADRCRGTTDRQDRRRTRGAAATRWGACGESPCPAGLVRAIRTSRRAECRGREARGSRSHSRAPPQPGRSMGVSGRSERTWPPISIPAIPTPRGVSRHRLVIKGRTMVTRYFSALSSGSNPGQGRSTHHDCPQDGTRHANCMEFRCCVSRALIAGDAPSCPCSQSSANRTAAPGGSKTSADRVPTSSRFHPGNIELVPLSLLIRETSAPFHGFRAHLGILS